MIHLKWAPEDGLKSNLIGFYIRRGNLAHRDTSSTGTEQKLHEEPARGQLSASRGLRPGTLPSIVTPAETKAAIISILDSQPLECANAMSAAQTAQSVVFCCDTVHQLIQTSNLIVSMLLL